MPYEIERRFLADRYYDYTAFNSTRIIQAYISTDPLRAVRVRMDGDKAFITIKGGSMSGGAMRYEWEQEISRKDARELMFLRSGHLVEKTRYRIPAERHTFEVDCFSGANEGLVVAEVELTRIDEPFERPIWLGEEITGEMKYSNLALSVTPFGTWGKH